MNSLSVFSWPSPLLWIAVAVLLAADANRFEDFVQAMAGLTIFAVVVGSLRNWVGKWWQRRSGRKGGPVQDDRLAELEYRLTETQEVMIALSEKIDRWEVEKLQEASGEEPKAPDIQHAG